MKTRQDIRSGCLVFRTIGIVFMASFCSPIPMAQGQPVDDCQGFTACPTDCPVWCQPSCASCETDCDLQQSCTISDCTQYENHLPCCGPDDNCETFPPATDCCEGNAPPNCDSLVEITDITGTTEKSYNGRRVGLYIDESDVNTSSNVLLALRNTIPHDHLADAKTNGSQIVPRNSSGTMDWANGKVGVLSLGFSNPMIEFEAFVNNHVVTSPSEMDSKLVFVNGAQGGTSLCQWMEEQDEDSADNVWEMILGDNAVDFSLLEQGKAPGQTGTCDENNPGNCTAITAEQVQVVWMKMHHADPLEFCKGSAGTKCTDCPNNANCDICDLCGGGNNEDTPVNQQGCNFPNWVYGEDGEVAAYKIVLEHVREYFPNIQQVFISSRAYGGYANGCDGNQSEGGCGLNMEPWPYVNGFTVQELMRLQIYEDDLPFPASCPPTSTPCYPLILWGPYLWANGTTPNQVTLEYEDSALSYDCWEWCADGGHPSADEDACGQTSGRAKIGQLLFNFFQKDWLAEDWFLPRPVINVVSPVRGTVDRLKDFKNQGGSLVQKGTNSISLYFDRNVRKPGGGSVDTTCFEVTSTCQDLSTPCTTNDVLPTVQSVTQDPNDSKHYTVALNRQIVPGHWTTLAVAVESAVSPYSPIRIDPWDRVDLAFLPGDANGDKTVNTDDYDRLTDVLQQQYPSDLTLHDINRDGSITNADRNRLQELLQGTNTTQAWANYTLPARP